jgi:hypothetical protein
MTTDVETRKAIRDAFRVGQLRVKAVNPSSGAVSLQVVSDVMQHNTAHKAMVRTTLKDGRAITTTVDHSLFHQAGDGIVPAQASAIKVGDVIATVGESLEWSEVAAVEMLPPEEHTYDLSVPGPENFVASNGILAHNTYSIGGVSLDIEKSSKYESAYSAIKDNWETQLDRAKQTVKIIAGLQQPRYGIGIRSSLGPYVGAGILTPAKFVGF